LVKEVLFKSDVENLIGKRPFEEKKILDVEPEEVIVPQTPELPNEIPDSLKTPPAI